MKKLLLLSILGGAALGAQAQQAKPSVVSIPTNRANTKNIAVAANSEAVQSASAAVGNKGAAVVSRWYNHGYAKLMENTIDPSEWYSEDYATFQPIWQDSTVGFSDEPSIGINVLSFAQTFHPQADIYNDEFLFPGEDLYLNNTTPYNLDSVSVMGIYTRTNESYVDTLIFTFLKEQGSNQFLYFSYGPDAASLYGIDSFAVLLWNGAAYQNAPINQISYSYGSVDLPDAVQIKVPLNNAVFADSLPNGLHMISAAPNIAVGAGSKISVSVAFKSGTTYTPGTPIDDYNYFGFISHEAIPGGFTPVDGNDLSMSYIVRKDSAGTMAAPATATAPALNFFMPTLAFSLPTSGPYSLEDHDISWKITANAETPGAVANVNSGITANAFPNPANTSLNVPVTVKADANVSVNITNAVGQVVATQNLGKVAAGQKATATFNTAALANGVYFYTVEANGQRLTQRFAVAH